MPDKLMCTFIVPKSYCGIKDSTLFDKQELKPLQTSKYITSYAELR